MVLRIIALTCLLTITPAMAKITARQSKIFKAAKRAYKNQDYQKTIYILQKGFKLSSSNTPSGAIQLAAYSYEKLGQLNRAQSFYGQLIKSRFPNIHREIIRSYRESGNADDLPEDIPEKLLEYYHRRIKIWAAFYKRDFDKYQYERMIKLQNQIRMYVEILSESDYDDDTVENLIQEIDQFNKERADQLYKPSLYLSLGYVSWKDVITLVTPSGERVQIKSTNEGLNLCGGYKMENAHILWKGSLCYASTEADVGNETSTISYFQKSVPVSMVSLLPGVLWKPFHGDTAVGISTPLVYRVGDYTTPDNHSLEDTSIFSYGYLLNLMWLGNPISVELQLGKLQSFSSSYWALNAIYHF